MASGKSSFLEKKLLDLVFGGTAYSPPATLYIALSLAVYAPGGLGSEVSGGSYARVAVTNDSTSWGVATDGNPAIKTNLNTISFPSATASWGTIRSAYIMDAVSGGNSLYGGDFISQFTVASGQTPLFGAGTFVIREQ